MKFSEIPGHETIKERMRQMKLQGRIPHALLLEGPAGIGKLSLARAFAQYIHCTNPTADGDSCGECKSCRLHQAMTHLDLYYVFPVVKADGAQSAPISDDYRDAWIEFLEGRLFMDFNGWASTFTKKNANPIIYVTESSALIRSLSLTSHISKEKIVIFYLPEKLNAEAANKILKLIEEPYENTYFIMVSDNPAAILPTIYSRVQRIKVSRMPDDTVAAYLSQQHGISYTDALAVAHNAEGIMTKAFDLLQQPKDAAVNFELFVSLMRLAYQRNVKELKAWSEKITELGREKEAKFYDNCIRLMRENFIYKLGEPQLNYMNSEENTFSSRFSRFITEKNVEKLIATFEKAKSDIMANANGKIVNFDTAIKVIILLVPR